jgi:hypothetical protein
MAAERAIERFIEELVELGYTPELHGAREVAFDYTIENGPRFGETVKLGFEVPENWPVETPHGPCYLPAILRGTGTQGVHVDGRHFGPEWDHWSRPYEGWAQTDYTLRAYMRHIRKLHRELPSREEEDAA